jgi:hypothetical protein
MTRRRVLSLRLKAQYIWWLGGALVGVLVLFAVMYFCGISSFICVPVAFGVGGWLVSRVYRMSKRYGQYGLMKRSAKRYVPGALISRSRKTFTQLFSSYASSAK